MLFDEESCSSLFHQIQITLSHPKNNLLNDKRNKIDKEKREANGQDIYACYLSTLIYILFFLFFILFYLFIIFNPCLYVLQTFHFFFLKCSYRTFCFLIHLIMTTLVPFAPKKKKLWLQQYSILIIKNF